MRHLAIAAVVAMPLAAHADPLNVAALAPDTNAITLTTGAEHGFIVGLGVARAASLADHPMIVVADATLSAAGLDPADFRVRAGAITPLLDGRRWKLLAGAAAVVRGTHDEIANMVDVGADASLVAGYYTPHWFAGGELGFDAALATHITATSAYRMIVYPDARDGWYRDTGGLFRAGVQAGVSVGDNDIALRAGMLRDVAGDAPLFPIYATLTYGRRW